MNKKVLIIDDDISILEGFKTLLKNQGYQVSVADKGKDAYRLAKGGDYDVFVVDFILPDMRGLDLAKKIRKIGKYETNKIIILTGYLTKEILEECQGIPICKCLSKPIGSEELIELIDSA